MLAFTFVRALTSVDYLFTCKLNTTDLSLNSLAYTPAPVQSTSTTHSAVDTAYIPDVAVTHSVLDVLVDESEGRPSQNSTPPLTLNSGRYPCIRFQFCWVNVRITVFHGMLL